jgi:hypothetical protein
LQLVGLQPRRQVPQDRLQTRQGQPHPRLAIGLLGDALRLTPLPPTATTPRSAAPPPGNWSPDSSPARQTPRKSPPELTCTPGYLALSQVGPTAAHRLRMPKAP